MSNLSSPYLFRKNKFIFWGLRITIVSFLLFFSGSVKSANSFDVVINEIAWMGTEVSYNNEWIELYNNTNFPIDLAGWVLKAVDETPKINLTGVIPVNSFYLLERTNDETVPNISADQIYTGALKNEGENLELFDNFGNLIDSINSSSGWFAGDNSTKQTMERINSLVVSSTTNWGTSRNPGGTPKVKNSVVVEAPQPPKEQIIEPEPQVEPESEPLPLEEEPQLEPQPELNPQPELELEEPKPITYPSGIIINEILPSPIGPDAEEEWIEIFNQNKFKVDISDWQIEDTTGKITTYTFSKGTEISALGFLVLFQPATKITLNNDGDGLKLIQPNGKVVDSLEYEKAPKGESFNRIGSEWNWSTILTPGLENIIPSPVSEKESKIGEPVVESPLEQGLAAVKEPFEKIQNKQIFKSLFVYLIALFAAIFSSMIIFFIKKSQKNLKD